MDGRKYIAGGDWKQIEIDRRRMSAIRDLKDALDRARNDLAFEMGRAINLAINLATKVLANGEPSSHDVFLVDGIRKARQPGARVGDQAGVVRPSSGHSPMRGGSL
jgi:hypothetical protein